MGDSVCSVDGCNGEVLARGWCGKHYSRWGRTGSPTALSPRLKREPGAPAASKRFVGSHLVYFTEAGDAFVAIRRKRANEIVDDRKYGVVITCEKCGKEAFIKESGGKRDRRFCSHQCAGPVVARERRNKQRPKKVATADRLFSQLVRTRGACENCGKETQLQCAHGFSRRYRRVRWDFRNAFCLCAGCHMFFTYRPLEWDNWLIAQWGEDLYAEIRRLALNQEGVKIDVPALNEALYQRLAQHKDDGLPVFGGHSGWRGLMASST